MLTIRDLIAKKKKVYDTWAPNGQELKPQTQLSVDCATFLIEKYGTKEEQQSETKQDSSDKIKIPPHYFTPREFSRELIVLSASYITQLLRQDSPLNGISIFHNYTWHFNAVALLEYVKTYGKKKWVREKAKRFLASPHDMQKLADLIKEKTS